METLPSVSNPFISSFISRKQIHTAKELFKSLSEELTKLIRILEIYLAGYVSRLDVNEEIPDIASIYYDKVLSFNYTSTIMNYYRANCEYSFIHGRAQIDREESNNMVLGFEDYYLNLTKQDNRLIYFQKYYQKNCKEY